MDNMDFYKILGVEKNATQDEIKAAYKRLAKQFHPDLQQNKTEAEKKAAEEKFKNVNTAYETLGDEEKRKVYDMGGQQAFGGFPGDPSDLFSAFASRFGFGGGFSGPGFMHSDQPKPYENMIEKDGRDLELNMKISLKEAIFGTTKKVLVPMQEECPDCHGTGALNGSKLQPCSHCNGMGVVEKRSYSQFGVQIIQSACPACNGSGISKDSLCKKCSGKGRVQKNIPLEIPVPKGAKTNENSKQRYCFTGKGICGVNGGKPGNLFVRFIEEPSELFQHSMSNPLNLHTKCYVNPFVALNGGTMEVYTPGGLKKCKIPEFTPPGKVFRIKNTWQPEGQVGDLDVTVVYDMPKKMTPKLKKFLGKITEVDDLELENDKVSARLYNEFNNK